AVEARLSNQLLMRVADAGGPEHTRPGRRAIDMASEQRQVQVPQFLAGDIILFAGQGDLYSRVGRWMMRGPREGPTYAVHTAQFLSSRRVLEMDFQVRIKSVDDVLNKRYKLESWKRRGFQ